MGLGTAGDVDRHVVERTRDPAAFLDAAGPLLAADPLVATIPATVASRHRADRAAGVPDPEGWPHWYAVVRDGAGPGAPVVGALMRTAPFAPHPVHVLPMPSLAALAVARWLHATGEQPVEVGGASPTSELVAAECARLAGGPAPEPVHPTRLFEVDAVVHPPRPRGGARPARDEPDEVALVAAWLASFETEADLQAGRGPSAPGGRPDLTDLAAVRRRVQAGRVVLWVVDGEPVHLTGFNAPAAGVARIAPVLTPRAHRGHGYAAACVAHVAAGLRGAGHRVCLFTDLDNPVTNRLYPRLGFRPRVDMAQWRL